MRRLLLAPVLAVLVAAPARAETIWSSGPLTGAGGSLGRDVRDAERLALAESGVSGITLRVVDDATRAAGGWDPATTARNARRAAQDATALAYLGEVNSGATAISLPVLNEAGIPQVSPSNTYVGLTRSRGGERGEPDRYYPTGLRTFFRVVPADHLEAAAIAALLARRGVHRLALAHDGDVYGRSLERLVVDAARARGLEVVLDVRLSSRGRNAARVARRVRASGAQGFVFTGITASGAPKVVRAVHARAPAIPLVVPDACLDTAFTRHVGAAAARTLITGEAAPAMARGPAGQAFADRFRARWHRSPGPYADYGYEAMTLVLDAIGRAGPGGSVPERRRRVVTELQATRDRDSILGRYSIDPQGDTTLSTYGVFSVAAGRPRFASLVDSAGS
jgi:branched-chain amino acid transport system substrate-binding protein